MTWDYLSHSCRDLKTVRLITTPRGRILRYAYTRLVGKFEAKMMAVKARRWESEGKRCIRVEILYSKAELEFPPHIDIDMSQHHSCKYDWR